MTKEQNIITYHFTENSLDDVEDIIFDILKNISKDCKYARLILEEWLTNIIKYGETKENITYITFPTDKSVIIKDNGKPFNMMDYPKKGTDIWTIGGKGIFLIRELSNSLYYEYKDGFNCLTINF